MYNYILPSDLAATRQEKVLSSKVSKQSLSLTLAVLSFLELLEQQMAAAETQRPTYLRKYIFSAPILIFVRR